MGRLSEKSDSKIKRFLQYLLVVETVVAGICYTLVATILFVDVVSREMFGQSVWGGQRMSILLANTAALIGISVAVALNRHIRPVVLDSVLPDKWVPLLVTRIGNCIAALTLFTGGYFAILLVLENKTMGFSAAPLDLKIWIPQCVLAYALFSSGLRYGCAALLSYCL